MAGRARWALIIAAVLGVLLIAGAFVPGPYQSVDETGRTWSSSLFDENGWQAVVVLSLPLAVTGIVAGALSAGWIGLGWVATGVLAALCLLAAMSVGLFAFPVVVLLVVACASAQADRPAQPAF